MKPAPPGPGLRALAFAVFPAVAIVGPLLVGPPNDLDLLARFLPPSGAHWLGTDDLGRDVLARLVYGARVSVATGALAAVLTLGLGTLVGAIAGLSNGLLARAFLLVIDVFQSVPPLVLAAAGGAFLAPSLVTTALLLTATLWTDAARLVRAEASRLKTAAHVEAARAAGASRLRLLFVHILPHALPPVLATAPYVLGTAVLGEAALSFLGLGTPPPTASWGRALADARGSLGEAWWCALAPTAALFLLVFSARRLGEALGPERLQSAAP